MAKVKKPHVIRVAGVSRVNGTDYNLNVSGRLDAKQLFLAAVPGRTEFLFVKLPHVMSKRDAVAYLLTQPQFGVNSDANEFLKGLLAKYDAVANKVPGKRGRPKGSKNKVQKLAKVTKVKTPKVAKASKPKVAKVAKVTKEVVAKVTSVEPVKVPASDADKAKIMEANRQKLREFSEKMKAAKRG